MSTTAACVAYRVYTSSGGNVSFAVRNARTLIESRSICVSNTSSKVRQYAECILPSHLTRSPTYETDPMVYLVHRIVDDAEWAPVNNPGVMILLYPCGSDTESQWIDKRWCELSKMLSTCTIVVSRTLYGTD